VDDGILITLKVPASCHNAKGMESEAHRRLYHAVALLFPQIGRCQLSVIVNRDERPRHFPRVVCDIDGPLSAFQTPRLLDLLVGTVLYHLVVLAEEYIMYYTTIRVEAQDGPYKQALAVWRNPLSRETGETDAAALSPSVFVRLVEQRLADVGADDPTADKLTELRSCFVQCDRLAGNSSRS
jgi:hypothetical protein